MRQLDLQVIGSALEWMKAGLLAQNYLIPILSWCFMET